jgi:nucleotide-binding universal stress UspA family protein
MEPFKRILVATDFSPCARLAVDCAAMLAKSLGGQVHVLYVSEIPDGLFGESVALDECFVDADVKEGRIQLERLLAELREEGIQADGEVRAGHTPDTIVEEGRPQQYDLLVPGTHGRTGLRRPWMGSVAERVLRASQIPVLSVRPPHLA